MGCAERSRKYRWANVESEKLRAFGMVAADVRCIGRAGSIVRGVAGTLLSTRLLLAKMALKKGDDGSVAL
eukprot:2513245-Prorocentrum_lima.AAC.1